ncbi:MAG: rhomboid family intramembrane serine protease [Crocinitomicaceae bacterium]
MEYNPKVIKTTLLLAASIVFLMGIVHAYNEIFDLQLYQFGIFPRTASGLIGILTGPFIHSTESYSHLFNNSIPTFVLTWLLFYNFRNIAPKVFMSIFLGTGVLVWLFARQNYHIGMSGVIYGLTSFLMLGGFLTKHLRVAAISLLVIFLYGSLIWGIFPIDPQISFEGHFSGFFAGALLAILYRKKLPQPDKFYYEIEEELGFTEYEDEYWKTDGLQQEGIVKQPIQTSTDPFQVIYHYKSTDNSEKKTTNQEDKKITGE